MNIDNGIATYGFEAGDRKVFYVKPGTGSSNDYYAYDVDTDMCIGRIVSVDSSCETEYSNAVHTEIKPLVWRGNLRYSVIIDTNGTSPSKNNTIIPATDEMIEDLFSC